MREDNLIKWYVDGRDYFWAVSEALEKAKETIYIADWWLSPELFLRRPPHKYKEWGLDSVLKRHAEAGVKIYVSVYPRGRGGADVQLAAYEACSHEPVSRGDAGAWKHYCAEAPGPQRL